MMGVLLVVAAAIFIATFDADQYRLFVVQKLESALGKPVQLEHISLGWDGGIALRLQQLSISDGSSAQSEPMVQLESASALLRFLPLLKKNVEIVSITLIQPRLRIVKRTDGTLNIQGAAPAQKEPVKKEQTAAAFLISEIAVKEGSLSLHDETRNPPVDLLLQEINITLKNVSLTQPIELRHFSAKTCGGTIRMSGTVRDVMALPQVTLDVALEELSLEKLLPTSDPNAPQLQGRFSASFQGSVQGKEWPELSKTLSGQGRLALRDGVIMNLNILREIFQHLSVIPGLGESLEARLPKSYQEKLSSQNTLLGPIDLPIVLKNGTLSFEHLQVSTDTFELDGTGEISLDGGFGGQAEIRIEPELSQALAASVNEFQYLTNERGQVAFPVKIKSHLPHVSVLPDLQYIASRLAVTKASEFLGKTLERVLHKDATPQ